MNSLDTVQLVSMLIGVVLPVVVGLVTTRVTHPGAKAILLAALSAVSGFATEWLGDPDAFVFQNALFSWVQTFVVAVASHYGLWKPTRVSAKVQETPGLVIRRRRNAA